MACFIVPAAEAAVSTVITKCLEKNEAAEKAALTEADSTAIRKIPFSRKMKWLSNLLWGGSSLLAFEHVWHGEVVPYFPFLTAASNPVDAAEMLQEMATTGVCMTLLVTAVWCGMLLVTHFMEKEVEKNQIPAK